MAYKKVIKNIVLVGWLFPLVVFSGMVLADTEETVNVVMVTEYGEITLELYPDKVPITVSNFLRYVDENIYADRAAFYRAVRLDNQQPSEEKIEVIQGGLGMAAVDLGNEDLKLPPIDHETTEQTGILHKDSVISMARFKPGTASSEFFICIDDQPSLDFGGDRNPDGFGFAAFGKVIKGMDVVRQIQNTKSDGAVADEYQVVKGQIIPTPVKIHEIKRQ